MWLWGLHWLLILVFFPILSLRVLQALAPLLKDHERRLREELQGQLQQVRVTLVGAWCRNPFRNIIIA